MIKSKDGNVRIDGELIVILEDFAYIVNSLHEMLSDDIGIEASKKVIANSCYVATAENLSDEESKLLARDTIEVLSQGLSDNLEM